MLAHFRIAGVSGIGIKPPDLLGAWACSACHSVIDSDKSDEVQRAFLEGVMRTQYQLIKERKIVW